jgi:HAD superfamily hydrolase (TIGR01509 family)
MGAYAAVIFDMDGVIVDSEPRHERAFLSVLEEIGYANRLPRPFAHYIGRSDRDVWVDFMEVNNPPHALEDLLARKRERVLGILQAEQPIFDGLPVLVRDLAGQGTRLALASGSERPVVDAVLAMADLHRHFVVTVSGSDIERGKPEPDIFLRAAALLGVPPESCVVIEDSKPGVTAARAAGMRVIAITNTHPADELNAATQVVGDYEEIRRLLLPSTQGES